MRVEKDTNNAFRQALEKRVVGTGLPSNFTHKMMERVHLEAQKQRKKRKVVIGVSFWGAIFVLLSLTVYILIDLDFNLMDYIPRQKIMQPDSVFMYFYGYIGVLVLILLGLDYWVRKYKRKSM